MEDLTDDALLADAIGEVALSALARLAGDADGRRALLKGFLRLAKKHRPSGPNGPRSHWESFPTPTHCLHKRQKLESLLSQAS
jgi:hypothetical protein